MREAYGWLRFALIALLANALPAAAQHGNAPDPILDEHAAAFALVAYEDATHLAVRSGAWSDPTVWEQGEVPTDGARVVVAEGIEVDLDYINGVVHKTIRVDGLLRFATDVDTELLVDTMIVGVDGHLQIGSVAAPVEGGVTARIIIADTGPIDPDWDPMQLSRGLIAHGRVTIHGEVKTSHLDLLSPAKPYTHQLELVDVPLNWRVGDVLIRPGSHKFRDFDETLYVTGIDGNIVDVAAIGSDGDIDPNWSGFIGWWPQLPAGVASFVINLSRNVVIQSENITHADEHGINRRRGHVMFMHNGVSKADTRYVGAYGLGRTDKRWPLNSPEFDAQGDLIPDSGHNTVARYSWHYHRGGPHNGPAIVEGLAIVDSPGLGLVNHSSNVEVSDSVAYNVVGSAWFSETGNEIGFFRRVAAVRMPGSGEAVNTRTTDNGFGQEPDFGHAGHGFWLQGGGVSLHDVRVAGAGDAGIVFFTRPFEEVGIGTARFDASLLANPEIADGEATVAIGSVPLFLEGAVVFGSVAGIATQFHQLSAQHQVYSQINDLVTASTGTALRISYTNQLHLENCTFIGNPKSPSGRAMRRNNKTGNIIFADLDVRGWSIGLDIPILGTNRVIDGVYQNVHDILIATTNDDSRVTQIEGEIQFLPLTNPQSFTRKYIYLVTRFDPDLNDITRLFRRHIIRLGTVIYEEKQLFHYSQAADYVPFPSGGARDYVPVEFIDRTNSDLWAAYGLAIGDAVAPDDAFEDPFLHALIGDPISYPPQIVGPRAYTNMLESYLDWYIVIRADGSRVYHRASEPVDLAEGWNIMTVEEDGYLRSTLKFGDIIPPVFVPSATIPSAINPLDIARAFTIRGHVVDNSFGSHSISRTFSGAAMSAFPIQFRADGSSYLEISFTIRDYAFNRTDVVYDLDLDTSELRAYLENREFNDVRPVMEALLAVLKISSGTASN